MDDGLIRTAWYTAFGAVIFFWATLIGGLLFELVASLGLLMSVLSIMGVSGGLIASYFVGRYTSNKLNIW